MELSNQAIVEAVRKDLSLLVVTSKEIPIDVVGATGEILEYFKSRLGVVMSSSK